MEIDKIIQTIVGTDDEKKLEGFLSFLSGKLWNLYRDDIMDKVKVAENEISWNLNIPNAKENQEYMETIPIPEVKSSSVLPGLDICLEEVSGIEKEKHGLTVTISQDGKSFTIAGIPTLDAFRKEGATAESTFELTLKYALKGDDIPEMIELEKKIPFVINQDPRKLWKDLPVDWNKLPEPKYQKEDSQCEYVKVEALEDGTPPKDIVAASKRGRSHAQEAKPRDDHFRVEHMDNGWYIMAVADGAGSAKFSRKGSLIACDESVDYCKLQLINCKAFEDSIAKYNKQKVDSEEEVRKEVGNFIYNIVGAAAFKAHKAINVEAALTNQNPKLYATTLLLTICKRFSFGWFIASFWVGDGAICLYNRDEHTAKILGVPDEGEYAGQTRFLTMPEIFKDATSLYQRLRFSIVNDFTALFLMSDGVSDPKFETDANLNNPAKWDELWDDLKQNGVDLTDDNEATKDQLLGWLDFWSPGNHDDRTIAILYEGENLNLEKATSKEGSQETIIVEDGNETEKCKVENDTLTLPDAQETIELDDVEIK